VFDVRTRKQLVSIEYGVFPDVSAVHGLSLDRAAANLSLSANAPV
jgi:hypothetical protein